MTTNISEEIEIDGIIISLSRKKIKHLHIKICLPYGEVKVSAPLRFNIKQITKFISKKIDWIKKSQNDIKSKKIILPPKFISGESHFLFGQKFNLILIKNSHSNVVLVKNDEIELHSKKLTSNFAERQKIMNDFYRQELKKKIPEFIIKYEKTMNVKVAEFGVKKMKTRWGTCNVRDHRIWINLELAKNPIECLDFIITHEMTHLLERKHSKRFFSLMDNFMPNWRQIEAKLQWF